MPRDEEVARLKAENEEMRERLASTQARLDANDDKFVQGMKLAKEASAMAVKAMRTASGRNQGIANADEVADLRQKLSDMTATKRLADEEVAALRKQLAAATVADAGDVPVSSAGGTSEVLDPSRSQLASVTAERGSHEPLRVVVSTPEMSWPDNENVMEFITGMCKRYPDLLKMGFDFAGSGSSASDGDKPRWERLFGAEAANGKREDGLMAAWSKAGLDSRGEEYEAVRDEIQATDWYATYTGLVIGSLKAAILESPTGTVVSSVDQPCADVAVTHDAPMLPPSPPSTIPRALPEV